MKNAVILSMSMIFLLYLSASNNDYTVSIKWETISYPFGPFDEAQDR
jgi:hypothetical protein